MTKDQDTSDDDYTRSLRADLAVVADYALALSAENTETDRLRRDLAAANARIAELSEECDAYQMQRDVANARVAELEFEAARAEVLHHSLTEELGEVQEALATERAETARLRTAADWWAREAGDIAARLAAATELLSEVAGGAPARLELMWYQRCRAFLAAQPAPAKEEP